MFIKTIDFSLFSSIKIGQPTDVLMIEQGDEIPHERIMIGQANNLLLSPTPPPLMMLSKDFSFCHIDGDYLYVGAATPTGRILSFAKRNNLAGFEFVAKLPGSLGGMVAMNAGVKSYEIFNIIDSLKINGLWVKKSTIPHAYRFAQLNGVVTEVRFPLVSGFDKGLMAELMAFRRNQPQLPSAGSAFKNPPNDHAGRLIDAVGLKGVFCGAMQWSGVHANFLVNHGGGSFEEAIHLIALAKRRVLATFGVTLEEEIRLL